jgi:hypothetical protein
MHCHSTCPFSPSFPLHCSYLRTFLAPRDIPWTYHSIIELALSEKGRKGVSQKQDIFWKIILAEYVFTSKTERQKYITIKGTYDREPVRK